DGTIGNGGECCLCLVREPLTLVARALDTPGVGHDADNVCNETIVRLFRCKELIHSRSTAQTQTWPRKDQRESHLVLAEIETGRFANHRRMRGVVEEIVGDLECHAKQLA